MKTVTFKDKTFRVSISEAELLKAVDNVAEKMNADLEGKNPLFLIVLNGAFMFASDLLKRVEGAFQRVKNRIPQWVSGFLHILAD